jgi:hypothetical protein
MISRHYGDSATVIDDHGVDRGAGIGNVARTVSVFLV